MKKEFQYQLLWLRVLGTIPIAYLVLKIQENVIHKMVLSDWAYGFDLALILLALSVYYAVTEQQSWYVRSGELMVQDGILIIKKRAKEISAPADQITELFLDKKSALGSYFMLFQIRWGKKKIKLYSKPIAKSMEIKETEFHELYQIIQSETPKLAVEKDIWGNELEFWMKRPKE